MKIQKLFFNLPAGVVLTSAYLEKMGITPQLVQKYKKSGWLERLGGGAYFRKQESISWEGALWAIQQNKKVFLAGKSALEIQGYEHFLSFGNRNLDIAYEEKFASPLWLRSNPLGAAWHFSKAPLKTVPLLNEVMVNQISLSVSCLEQAILECCAWLPKYYTFEEVGYFMESLTSLRPEILQNLLEKGCSFKARRVFLFLAERTKHSWFRELNTSKLSLGDHKIQIQKRGIFNAKYLMTVPKGFS
ncbi:MAG: hypothetical protein B7Y25_05035 [Alphaproteobacteria bacterium 16-39-46]|nr:MAG: hypothetical protein B7Y25_05035 [Alphaproteobacteria bacterium 16-39-46]OZA42819.1 MAG: hypothetical protein B7X84_04835 [Alphaproteobacteria bacterium 17-39-52]HQS84266.1 type IV toxin-antitoxin system AbiEi family antitoxin domain-containing protein [Alphaproteobacteria bacterium]HQS94118.1 type IV toxin-antitoxin system AbiEi family antitoxin domain-containing protein [Alphaproteobacteria bacterium]